jgi:hypothetical protein
MRAEYPLHRAPTPGTTSAAAPAQRGDRSEGMAVDLSKVDRPARAAAWAEHVEQWRPRDRRGPDRRRPQHVAAEGKLAVPALNDGLGLGARCLVRGIALEVRMTLGLPLVGLTCWKPASDDNSRMRLFWVPLVIVVLFAVDRAYMDGQNADQLMSLARWGGAFVNQWVADMLRPLR